RAARARRTPRGCRPSRRSRRPAPEWPCPHRRLTAVTGPPASVKAVADAVEARLADVLDAETARWTALTPDLEWPLDALRRLVLAGGKRLRPAFCHWAFVGAGGDPDDPRVVDAGAAFELLHAFALVHDDVMDDSDTRRGLDTIHAEFAAHRGGTAWGGESRRFGEG